VQVLFGNSNSLTARPGVYGGSTEFVVWRITARFAIVRDAAKAFAEVKGKGNSVPDRTIPEVFPFSFVQAFRIDPAYNFGCDYPGYALCLA
jgi:hypothetical protein